MATYVLKKRSTLDSDKAQSVDANREKGERLAEGGEHPLVAFLGLCLGQQLYEVISHAGRDGIAVQFSNKRIGLSSGYEYN
jgi:hypothetical protein